MYHPNENDAELFSVSMHMMSSGSHRTTLPVDNKYIETNSCVIINGMLHRMIGYNMVFQKALRVGPKKITKASENYCNRTSILQAFYSGDTLLLFWGVL